MREILPYSLGYSQPGRPSSIPKRGQPGLETVRFQGLGTLLQGLQPAKRNPLHELQQKMDLQPDRITYEEFRILQAAQSGKLSAKQIDAFFQPEKTDNRFLTRSERAIEANKRVGAEYAKSARKTAKVLHLDKIAPPQNVTYVFEITKLQLPNGKIGVSLSLNGVPWKFQPDDTTQGSISEDFLMAHDILRHHLLNRDRTVNTTSAAGEYLTGQVTGVQTLFPKFPQLYDGVLANAAESLLQKRKGSFSFRQLRTLISEFRTRSEIPVGSRITLEFNVPPADIAYEMPDTPKHTVSYSLVDEPGSGGYPLVKVPALIDRMERDPKVKKKVIHLTEDGSTEKMTLTQYAKKPDNKFGLGLTEVYEIKRLGERVVSAKKYYRPVLGHHISAAEGRLRLAHHSPKRLYNGAVRCYQVQNPAQNRISTYYFSHYSRVRDQVSYTAVIRQPEPKMVYTGYPYRPPTAEAFHLFSCSRPISKETRQRLEDIFHQFKDDFTDYQTTIQALLEQGSLPLDVPLGSEFYNRAGSTLLDHYNKLHRDKKIPPTEPPTVETILKALYRDYLKRTMSAKFMPGSKIDAFQEETDHIAAFPLPPYRPSEP